MTDSFRIPQPSRHRTGQAVVRLNGRDHYLGRHGSAQAKANYEALIARWLAHGRQLPDSRAELSVNDILLAYDRFAETYYRPTDKVSTELVCIRDALKIVKALYGRTPAGEFGPKKLRAVRQTMIAKGWSRGYVNHQVNRLKRMFKWATGEELVPASVHHALQAVTCVRKGAPEVRETEPVRPVPRAFVDVALPFMPPPVRAMVQLQLLTGMRPGEACILRGCDLETAGRVWIYRPAKHKTEHHGHDRQIFIGPAAQEVLRPWLRTDLGAYLFSPAEAEAARHRERRRNRRTPRTPSEANRRPKQNPKRAKRDRYDRRSYYRAIQRACAMADRKAHEEHPEVPAEEVIIPAWHPNQLRHNAATTLRKEYGIELARIVLGHSKAFTTEIYAEADRRQAIDVIAKIG
jgi:integrase